MVQAIDKKIVLNITSDRHPALTLNNKDNTIIVKIWPLTNKTYVAICDVDNSQIYWIGIDEQYTDWLQTGEAIMHRLQNGWRL